MEAKKIILPGMISIDDTVKLLQSYEIKGEHVYCEFNGRVLYSHGITLESAYQQIYHMSKEEYEEQMKKYEEERKAARKAKVAKDKEDVDGLIKRGNEVVLEYRQPAWAESVKAYAAEESMYGLLPIWTSVVLMEELKKGKSVEECAKISISNPDNFLREVSQLMLWYAPQGVEYVEAVHKTLGVEVSESNKKIFEKIREENRKHTVKR